VVALLLLVDLVLFGRGKGVIPLREAALWSVGWTVLGVAFGGLLWVWQGSKQGEEYLAGFVIEKSLSIDNLFVFALIFTYFAVPATLQRRVLFWGITGAVVLRALFILAGAALLDAAHFTIYVFGAFLVVTGIRMARHQSAEIHPDRNPVLRLVRRVVPMSDDYEGDRFFTRRHGALVATPMLAALALIATFDVVFAVDSIPAIFAVTRDTFVVFAANAFSLLGLSALYFLLVGMMGRFRFLSVGLAVVLIFVGAKMLVSDVYTIPVYLSLAVIVALIGGAVVVSLLTSRDAGDAQGAPASGDGSAGEPARGAVR
jgi:tellurite resistance protein TerC